MMIRVYLFVTCLIMCFSELRKRNATTPPNHQAGCRPMTPRPMTSGVQTPMLNGAGVPYQSPRMPSNQYQSQFRGNSFINY